MKNNYQNLNEHEKEEHSICPSKEFVDALLTRCAKELGVEYIPEPEPKLKPEEEKIIKEIKELKCQLDKKMGSNYRKLNVHEKEEHNRFLLNEYEGHSICPSMEFVDALLTRCEKELGVEYTPPEPEENELIKKMCKAERELKKILKPWQESEPEEKNNKED